jgi:hypothetical protein
MSRRSKRLVLVLSLAGPLALLAAIVAGSAAAGLPQCRTTQLTARTSAGTAGLGHAGFVLVLTNRSSTACRTGGYVGLLRLDRERRRLPTAVHRGSGYLFESRAPRTLVVGAGRSVSAGVEWLDAAGPADPADCFAAGRYLEVTPPNERTHLTIRAETGDCDGGFISTTALEAGAKGPRT